MGTKEQGGPETFKFNTAWNDTDKKFFISLISRKSYHTARLNLEPEEYAVILNRMVSTYERQMFPVEPIPHIDPDDEMKDLAVK